VVGETDFVPLVDSLPDQPLVAVHAVAFVLDHVRVALEPDAMLVGFAVSVTVGAGVAFVTVTVAVAVALGVPAAPVQVMV
jgi:hypothetical protein